ncbi:MAG: hypothetical protein JXR60_08030 [Bacteroidales bacterium]|nr:hypothetical protein [Bacteroidales bacterium]
MEIQTAERTYQISTIVLDLNGTLAVHGKIASSTLKLLDELKKLGLRLVLISGDIRGNAIERAQELGLEAYIAKNSTEKAIVMQQFDKNSTVAIGNARIDIGTFENASLSIATLQDEGIHPAILPYVDILVPSIDAALALFLNPKSLEATLRQ